MYDGEIDLLELRLHELNDVVDVFVVVESTRTTTGNPKRLALREQWARVEPFWTKLRYVVVDDDPDRNSVLRATADAKANDLILLSDVGEIPRAGAVRYAAHKEDSGTFGFRLSVRYFALNFCNVSGPRSNITWTVGFTPNVLAQHSPDALRHAVRSGDVEAVILDDAGWRFSYLSDRKCTRRETRSYSRQDDGGENLSGSTGISKVIANRADSSRRSAFAWDIVEIDTLPDYVRSNSARYARHILRRDGTPSGADARRFRSKLSTWLSRLRRRTQPSRSSDPVIICPYVDDSRAETFRRDFGLDERRGRKLDVFMWKDSEMIGPERAFEYCWSLFPQRDIIILHTDMQPMPDDHENAWYDALLSYVARLPDAGAIACDLLFPKKNAQNEWVVQSGGGMLEGGIWYLHGMPYDSRFAGVRQADWVTFGGVYIRRECLDMCGAFDRIYKWAYVMDVDYCMEIRTRGLKLYQVPVTLLHEENVSTKPFLDQDYYRSLVRENLSRFDEKWQERIPQGNLRSIS